MAWWVILSLIVWATGYVGVLRLLGSVDVQLGMIGAPVTSGQRRSRRVVAALWPIWLLWGLLAVIGWSVVSAFRRSQR